QGEQPEGLLLHPGSHLVDLGVVFDDLLGEFQVSLQESLGGALHGFSDHGRHGGQLFRQIAELLLKGLTHNDHPTWKRRRRAALWWPAGERRAIRRRRSRR